MLKKAGLFLSLLILLPSLANAWTITARVMAGTGVIYNGATAITPTPGYITLSNTSDPNKTLRVTPTGFYAISQVLVDGILATGVAAPDGISKDYTISYNGVNSHTINAYFAVPQVTVTSSQVPHGSFTIQQTAPRTTAPTTGNLTVTAGSKIKVVAVPNSTYRVARITVGAADYVPASQLPAGVAYTVSDITISGNTTVTAAYLLVPTVNPALSISSSSPYTGSTFTFDATGTTSNDTGLQYAFTVVDANGATVHTRPAGPAITDTYVPTTAGTYTVTMTATTANGGSGSRSAFFQALDRVENETQQCTGCHINSTPTIVTLYNGSPHAGKKSCQDCHTATPHGDSLPDSNLCSGCHAPHAWPSIGICLQCHNAHDPNKMSIGYPHFSSFTTAQYVTVNISCNNCHISAVDGSFNIYSANKQWAKSGKGNPLSPAWTANDFKTMGTPSPATAANTVSADCVRCHTTTGFIKYVTPTDPENPATAFRDIAPWGAAGDRTREMVACSACHAPTPFSADFGRRSVGYETNPTYFPGITSAVAWYGYSSAGTKRVIRAKSFANPAGVDMADSNICIVCHTGTSAGDLIKQSSNCTTAPSIACRAGSTGTFWGNVAFIDPHNMGAANIMFPDGLRAGYEYRTGTSSSPFHTNIGLEDTQGPCVACHMSAPQKHRFAAISSAQGRITAITSPICATAACHDGGVIALDPDVLQGIKDGWQAAAAIVANQLAGKGIHYNATKNPYFFTTDDPALQGAGTAVTNWNVSSTYQGANLMGAAFNLRLVQSDGGSWVHNSAYVKRLLYDTIDYLDGGTQNNTVASAIQNATVDQTVKDKAAAYLIPRP